MFTYPIFGGGGAPGGGSSTLLNNLVSWWTLDEASGTRVDSTSSGYDLGDSTLPVGQVSGKVGNASSTAHLTGARLLISYASSPNLHPLDVDYTVAGWFNLTSTGNNAALFSNWDFSGGHAFWIAPGETQLTYTVGSTHLGTFVASTATWYHFVCSHDATGNTIDVRINDTTDYSTAHTTGIDSGTDPFVLHNYTGAGNFSINGALDEVAAWSRLLTSAEITELYNSGSGITYTDL